MTHQLAVARGRDIIARWHALAEQRLEYLAELFETGRWRPFQSEHAFLENIQEAKAAVEAWRDLSRREASFDNSAVDFSWLGRGGMSLPRGEASPGEVHRPEPQPIPIFSETPPPIVPMPAEADSVCPDDASPALAIESPALESSLELLLDIDSIEKRYPLLRNAL
jgi:uncharacterized repeat protein (TIGR03809 family)